MGPVGCEDMSDVDVPAAATAAWRAAMLDSAPEEPDASATLRRAWGEPLAAISVPSRIRAAGVSVADCTVRSANTEAPGGAVAVRRFRPPASGPSAGVSGACESFEAAAKWPLAQDLFAPG